VKTKLLVVITAMLFLTIGCAQTAYFGVPSNAAHVPAAFGETEAVVQKAEKSPGSYYCPEKIGKAQKLGKQGIETYWACRTNEAFALLAESRRLAEEAMLCSAPIKPAPPKPMQRDSDGDGVYDDKDQCPNTPARVSVDSVGCPLDSDKDGVYDYKDSCPRTPMGAKVDAWGCWILEMVYFDTNKYNIKSQYEEILDEVASVMKKNPSLKLEVEGHTDNRASEKYNQALSENRANAVISYLIQSGVARMKITGKGYGLAKPAIPNNSRQNMAKNRRAELTPMW
jgi:hypothetical protein